MGNKIIKALLIVCLFFFSAGFCYSANLPFVRVGISDNSFKKLEYNTITIISTDSFAIYDKSNSQCLAQFEKNDKVTFNYSEGKFNIDKNGKRIIKNFEGTIIIHSPNGILGVDGLIRLKKQAYYHGVFEIIPINNWSFYLVNTLDIQQYLKGVVPNEMPVSFGLEALKAQAIAARNYVLIPRVRAHKEFGVDDSVASQVYFGANTESALSSQAVDETMGLVALYDWNMILAQYCSTAGGYTESFENAFSDNSIKRFPAQIKPYLTGRPDIYGTKSLESEEDARRFYMTKPDSYDIRSPYYRWKREFEREELESVLKATLSSQSKTGFIYPAYSKSTDIGTLKEIRVLRRGLSGKVMELEIITSKGTWKVSKELVIRRVFQKNGNWLPSANIVFDSIYDSKNNLSKMIIYGGGYGHGVGMSQYGAGFMATELNKNFVDILQRYYWGITISTEPQIVKNNEVSVSFYAPQRKAVLVVQNNNGVSYLNANINGRIVKLSLDKKLFDTESRIDISCYIKKGENDITLSIPYYDRGKQIKFYVELVKKNVRE